MLLVLVCFGSVRQPFCFSSFSWSVVLPLAIGKPLKGGENRKKIAKNAERLRENYSGK